MPWKGMNSSCGIRDRFPFGYCNLLSWQVVSPSEWRPPFYPADSPDVRSGPRTRRRHFTHSGRKNRYAPVRASTSRITADGRNRPSLAHSWNHDPSCIASIQSEAAIGHLQHRTRRAVDLDLLIVLRRHLEVPLAWADVDTSYVRPGANLSFGHPLAGGQDRLERHSGNLLVLPFCSGGCTNSSVS